MKYFQLPVIEGESFESFPSSLAYRLEPFRRGFNSLCVKSLRICKSLVNYH
jgi:hypothetical protein